jgi:hypothetical protein
MQVGAEVQNEMDPASLRVCSLVLLCDWNRQRGEGTKDGGPGIGLERPGASPSLSSLLLASTRGLHFLSLEDVLAVSVDYVRLIDVDCVIALTAVTLIHLTVRSADRVIATATEQLILTETAIYAVVTGCATYHVGTTAAVAIVVACLSRDGVCGTESVDAVHLSGALEYVLLKCAPYVFGQRHPAEQHHSYQQSPAK